MSVAISRTSSRECLSSSRLVRFASLAHLLLEQFPLGGGGEVRLALVDRQPSPASLVHSHDRHLALHRVELFEAVVLDLLGLLRPIRCIEWNNNNKI